MPLHAPTLDGESVMREGSFVMAKARGFKDFWPAKVTWSRLACTNPQGLPHTKSLPCPIHVPAALKSHSLTSVDHAPRMHEGMLW